MPLLRKTGTRSPWLPSPLQGSLERVRPAMVAMAIVPSVLLGSNAQFVGRLPRAEDTSNPPRTAVVVQQPAPVPGALSWMPRPLDAGVVAPPDKLSPLQVVSAPTPYPGARVQAVGAVHDGDRLPVTAQIVSGAQPVPQGMALRTGAGLPAPTERPAMTRVCLGAQPVPYGSVVWGVAPRYSIPGSIFAPGAIRGPNASGTLRSPNTTGTING